MTVSVLCLFTSVPFGWSVVCDCGIRRSLNFFYTKYITSSIYRNILLHFCIKSFGYGIFNFNSAKAHYKHFSKDKNMNFDLIPLHVILFIKSFGKITKLEFKESNMSPGKTKVKQSKFIEFISQDEGLF